MRRAAWILGLLCTVLLVSTASGWCGQVTIRSDDQFEFAEKQLKTGKYREAVREFERFIHFFPEDPKVPRARLLIGIAFLHDKAYQAARGEFAGIRRDYPESEVADQALFLMGEAFYRQGQPEEASSYLESLTAESPKLADASRYRLGWNWLRANRWETASDWFSKVSKQSPLYPSAQELATQSLKGAELPRKRPDLAGVMAGIVPGLGHAYCGRYRDALIAFVINGVFIWAAVESFHQDHEVIGGALCFLEAGWYSGNIYSAVNVAHKHNRGIEENFRKSLDDRLKLHIFGSKEGHIGIGLSLAF